MRLLLTRHTLSRHCQKLFKMLVLDSKEAVGLWRAGQQGGFVVESSDMSRCLCFQCGSSSLELGVAQIIAYCLVSLKEYNESFDLLHIVIRKEESQLCQLTASILMAALLSCSKLLITKRITIRSSEDYVLFEGTKAELNRKQTLAQLSSHLEILREAIV